ncbi:MAG TPA: lipoyl(octanoyl) transferase LipB [Lacibacter sp.]|nr:lipoyl(octanoyl) transferase LipB [Lacibacter sp.]HMO89337.1 lipoyl(octanoyl) transferase LipB [Lacibacter sp.]HMP88469.1 lipoyl(octanoyl) transferase LipB [Lacibacter sp.]
MAQPVLFEDLGNRPYKEVWDYQERLLQENLARKAALRRDEPLAVPGTQHHLLFVEHPPVYTLGKSGDVSHILISDDERLAKGIAYYPTNRGGDITFHGPQQLVGYPILDLEKFKTDIGLYLRNLEEVIIRTMAVYGLEGKRSSGETGVWLDPEVKGRERKICAMGVRCSRWVTMHGFAFNINTNLDYFSYIVPCGIQNKQVTSLQRELGRQVDMEEVKREVRRQFEAVFDVQLVAADNADAG